MGTPRKRGLLAAAVLAPIVLFAAAYLIFFTPDSEDEFRLSTGDSTGQAGEATDEAAGSIEGRWEVAAGTEAGYRVREKLAQLPAPSDAVGRTGAVTGGFTVVDEDGKVLARDLEFESDLSTLKSDNDKRDNRIRELGLESARFPKATFVAAQDVVVPEDAVDGKPAKTEVVGDLTIHGVTKRVTIPLDVQRNGNQVEVVGSLTFPFSDFGMQVPNVPPFVSVEPDATMEMKLVLERAAT